MGWTESVVVAWDVTWETALCATGAATGTGGSACSTAAWLSRTEGSVGIGPSIAHRLDSYLDRMKDSILLQMVLLKQHHIEFES